ncbi:hypothetical protein B7L09_07860 [Pseudomonas mandelii]|nr:hypothetical protein B7L09_07860 [Pseudomonas mandelii]
MNTCQNIRSIQGIYFIMILWFAGIVFRIFFAHRLPSAGESFLKSTLLIGNEPCEQYLCCSDAYLGQEGGILIWCGSEFSV